MLDVEHLDVLEAGRPRVAAQRVRRITVPVPALGVSDSAVGRQENMLKPYSARSRSSPGGANVSAVRSSMTRTVPPAISRIVCSASTGRARSWSASSMNTRS